MSASSSISLFERLARETWERIRDAHELRISLGEETITDLNLLEMRRANLPDVHVTKLTKGQEATRGVDWDWWIGNDVSGWVRYAVQAKRVHLPDGKLQTLRHPVNDGRSPRWQIERLEAYSRASRSLPVYCLYLGGLSMRLAHGCCPTVGQIEQYGCSIAPLHVMQHAHASGADKRVSRFFASLLPWRCLLVHHQYLGRFDHLGWPGQLPGLGEWESNVRWARLPTVLRAPDEWENRLPEELYPDGVAPKNLAVIRIPESEAGLK